MTRLRAALAIVPCLAALAGCSGEGNGSVQVFVVPEDTVSQGLEPGTGEENINDGWKITYTKFLVTVGNVRAERSDTRDRIEEPSVYVLDLLAAPAQGYSIATFDDVAAVRWDRFGYDLPNAATGVKSLAPTRDEDRDFMILNGYSIYFEGAAEKADGQSCVPGEACVPAPQVTFRWGLPAGTSFDDCESSDGIAGFAVPTGSQVQIKPTIHGDHWFFSNFTAGTELTARRAQYIADCDLDHDGETRLDELAQVAASEVFPPADYNLSGALGGPVNTAYDYVLAQSRTLGDYQGDGECPTRALLP